MIKTKKLAMLLGIIGVLGVSSVAVKAENHSYNYSFGDTGTTMSTASYAKSDSDQHWYLSIDQTSTSTLSSSNIFGSRMHRTVSDTVDVYHTFSNYISSYPISYASSVSKGDYMYMSSKKDSTSTSSAALKVSGRFAP